VFPLGSCRKKVERKEEQRKEEKKKGRTKESIKKKSKEIHEDFFSSFDL
jgi:hypothetical protein